VRVVEGVGSGARDVRLHTGTLPVRAGDGIDGAADGDGGFQVWVHGPTLARMRAAAGALGILFTQYAFLAHEASHRQVFESGRVNDAAGRTTGVFTDSVTPADDPAGDERALWDGIR